MLTVLLFVCFFARGEEQHAPSAVSPASLSKEWFHPDATLQPQTLHAITQTIHSVMVEGVQTGWIFRTDQVLPKCQGKRGEIVLQVGIGTDRLIKGLKVVEQREDAKYFSRLKETFYKQFLRRPVEQDVRTVDTVTSATRSSKAIREEVLLGARHIASQPEVANKTSPQKHADVIE